MTNSRPPFMSKNADGDEVLLRFNRPNQVTLSKGDFVYRQYFSKAIRAGVMTNAEANKVLKEREIWGEEQERELIDINVQIADLEDRIKKAAKKSGMSLYGQIKNLRNDADMIANMKTAVMDNTAEAMAAEMRTQFFAALCTVYDNSGEKVFKDLKDFLARLDEPIAIDGYRQALISNYEYILGINVPLNIESSLPEDVWLKEQNEKKVKTVKKSRKKSTKKVKQKV